jgi:P27 family predicted phage terminase small subunit
VLKGNPGKRALPKNEPTPERGIPDAPAILSPEARAQWDKVSTILDDANVLTVMDADALAIYCEAYARWVKATDDVHTFGMVIYTPNGYPVQSPWLSIANQAAAQMVKMLVEFGMTPASRSRVTAHGDEGEDPMEAFLRGKQG